MTTPKEPKRFLTAEEVADMIRASDEVPPMVVDLVKEAQEGPASDTLVPCPACAECPICNGSQMVTPEAAAKARGR